MLSRRGFVAAGGSIVLVTGNAAGGAVLGGLKSLAEDSFSGESPGFSRAQFSKLINTRFHGHLDSGDYSFELVALEDGAMSPGVEQFRLLFRASSADLPDGNYQINHESDGQLRQQLLRLEATGDDLPADIYSADFCLLA